MNNRGLKLKIGIYLGDVKKPASVGDLTFELSFVDELLSQKTKHEFVFYYFGKENLFKEYKNAQFVCLKYFYKPVFALRPFSFKTYKKPVFSLNYRMKKDNINVACFLFPYIHEHIEIPYYAVIRDVAHRVLPHFPEFSANQIVEKMEKKFNLFLISASKIITCNDIAKNDIKTIYSVIDENIATMKLPCPNWVKNIKDDDRILISNYLQKNSYVLYPAQFWTHKNHIRLILAAQIMQEQNMNLKVVFTGLDRGNKQYLLNKVKELDLNDDIIFLDYVNQSELAALYKNAFAVVYPSLAGVDSIAALEAIYFKCPVLISDLLGYNCQLKKSALYFNPLDEADIVEKITLLNNMTVKDELSAMGNILIEESDFKNFIEKFLLMADDFYLTRQCWSLEENFNGK